MDSNQFASPIEEPTPETETSSNSSPAVSTSSSLKTKILTAGSHPKRRNRVGAILIFLGVIGIVVWIVLLVRENFKARQQEFLLQEIMICEELKEKATQPTEEEKEQVAKYHNSSASQSPDPSREDSVVNFLNS